MSFFKKAVDLLKRTFSSFSDDNALKMSASLSYYTIFSMAPMLIVIISVGSLVFGEEAVTGQVVGQIRSMVGAEAARQVQDVLKKAALSGKSGMALALGIGTLILGASGVFAEMQDSINRIWSLKVKPKSGWLKIILTRLLSFSMVISLGFMLLVSLALNAFLGIFSNKLEQYFSDWTVYLFYIINNAVVLLFITAVFVLIFKVLPDARIRCKDALIGACFTAVLFMIGKFLIGYYIGQSDLSSVYGSAGYVLIMLTWVYYTSAILFFGAEFTKEYAKKYGGGVRPDDDAVIVYEQEVRPGQKNRDPRQQNQAGA